jgi:hypothetical protein
MRRAASVSVLALVAACSAEPEPPRFAPPETAAVAQKIMHTSYHEAIPRLSAADKADDERTNRRVAAISGKKFDFNARQTAMNQFTDGDPTVGLREMTKVSITAIDACVWERMQGDQHTADLFDVSATHGYRCALSTRREGIDLDTCKVRMETSKMEGYFFMAGDTLRYVPTPEGAFAPFGSNPWGLCQDR